MFIQNCRRAPSDERSGARRSRHPCGLFNSSGSPKGRRQSAIGTNASQNRMKSSTFACTSAARRATPFQRSQGEGRSSTGVGSFTAGRRLDTGIRAIPSAGGPAILHGGSPGRISSAAAIPDRPGRPWAYAIVAASMSDPAYPVARAVAADVRAHFERHIAAARRLGRREVADAPDVGVIESIIDAAFWAEPATRGRHDAEDLAGVPAARPRRSPADLRIAPAASAPSALAKLAPAVERPGIHLGVWREGAVSTCGARRAESPRSAS